MEIIPNSPKIRMSRQNLQTIIMKLVSMAKQIPEDRLMQEVTEVVSQLDTEKRKVKPEYVIKRTLKRLEEAGNIIRMETDSGSPIVSLTETGSEKLHRASLSGPSTVVPTSWDGKWRMVILDFESDDKKARDAVRYMLKKANFYCLKQSVWLTPHDLGGFIKEMKYHMHLTSEVMLVIAHQIDEEIEREVKEYFAIK